VIDPYGYYERLGSWLMSMEEVIGWYVRGELRGFTLTKREDHWLMTLKITKKGQPMVCFVSGQNLAQTIHFAALDVARGTAKWREDRYKSTVSNGS